MDRNIKNPKFDRRLSLFFQNHFFSLNNSFTFQKIYYEIK